MRVLVLISILTAFLTTACGKGFAPAAGFQDASSLTGPTTNCTSSSNPYCSTHFGFGTLGDSISRGYDMLQFGQEDTAENWSSGVSLPGSQIELLSNLFAQKNWAVTADIHNFAVTGQTVLGTKSTFTTNVSQMAATMPDYITLLIGANDICHGFVTDAASQDAFRAKIYSALETLVNVSHPPKVIAVASVPHIFGLTQIPTLANNDTCKGVWQLVCPNLSVGQATFDQQWTMVNQAIADAAAAVGGPVVFDGGAVAATTFTADDVSTIDCFHPSTSGQTKIASQVWQQVESAVQTKIINQ